MSLAFGYSAKEAEWAAKQLPADVGGSDGIRQALIECRPVMFDDTVYLSFATEREAQGTLERLNSDSAIRLLSSLIFWDDKRPIKTGILNLLDWSRIESTHQQSLPQQMKLLA